MTSPSISAAAAVDRESSRAPAAGRAVGFGAVVLWLGIATVLVSRGIGYYALPLQERAYAVDHELLKPSGDIGLGYGFIGTAMMLVGVAGYSARRRVRWLQRLGKLKAWLGVHIFLCTMGPFLILLHTSLKFGGLVSIAFWSMFAVVASGVFGRYVYVRIPKTLNGQFLSLRAIEDRRTAMLNVIVERSGLSEPEVQRILAVAKRPAPRGFAAALAQSLWYDLAESRHSRAIQRLLECREAHSGRCRQIIIKSPCGCPGSPPGACG